ncbi:helix-turn-helix domain-containing protein [Crossiella sp. CA198]|uniref:helix-turn-helix domain-containing protein n=1 Tax=Crossiella sp. CA198 TaxID=3455607 RepID=UPI003F8D2C5B
MVVTGGRRLRVVVPLLGGVGLFELAVPCEVFGCDRVDLTPRWYQLTLCQADPGPRRTPDGLRLEAPEGLVALEAADLVVVPAGISSRPPESLLHALRRAHRRGARLAAVCSGVFVLAAAGLLEGRTVTTHWMYAERLRRDYPGIRVAESALYTDDGDILTSGGTAAGIDLCLHIVRKDFGTAIAAEVGRRMVIAPHREGDQTQYIPPPAAPAGQADSLGSVLDWALHRLHEPLTLRQFAERAAMSTRTFGRHFSRQVGLTPLRWLNQQRLTAARELLETTDLTVDRIAERTGFATGQLLRQHFRRALRTTPSAYRRTFGA